MVEKQLDLVSIRPQMLNFEHWSKSLANNLEFTAKFINTLSMLEYMGARKIVKSQRSSVLSLELLSHISEEIRHAEVLKKLTLKMSAGKLDSYSDEHLLCGNEARIYIQSVDRSAELLFGAKNPWLNYLYTTFLLEERANVIYPHCGERVEELGFPNIFKGILREENRHLESIFQGLGAEKDVSQDKLDALKKAEDKAFCQFLASLNEAVEKSSIESNLAQVDSSRIVDRVSDPSRDQSSALIQ